MKKKFLGLLLIPALIFVAAGVSVAANNSTSEEIRSEIKELRERLDALESQNTKQQESIVHIDRHLLHAEDAPIIRVNGLEFAIGATGVLQGSAGVDAAFNSGKDRSDTTLSMDVEAQSRFGDGGLAFAHFEIGAGTGLDAKFSTLTGLNADAGDSSSGIDLAEIWYEHTFADGKVIARAGKINLGGDFDTNAVANSETDQFLSGSFVNNIAIEFPGYSPGMAFWFAPGEMLNIGVSIGDGDGDWDNIFDDTFGILEVGVMPKFSDRQGNYRFFYWYNATAHTELLNGAQTSETGKGYGISADQEITETFAAFFRYGYQDKKLYQVAHAWSAGLQVSMKAAGRPDDVIGVAFGQAVLGSDYKLANPGVAHANENHAEAYYKVVVNENLHISPDIQWVGNANGLSTNGDLWAFGLRSQFNF